MLRYYLVETTLLIRFGERLGSGLNGIVQVWSAVYRTLPTISEKVDVDRTTLLLPTNGQEPDAEALRKFYDEIEIQENEDNPAIKQEAKEFHSCEKDTDTKNVPENAPENVPENVPEKRHKVIIEMIQSNPFITIPELATICSVNEKTIKRDIQQLKTRNLLTRIGPDKGGYWKVILENI